jgi:hypothetical protein
MKGVERRGFARARLFHSIILSGEEDPVAAVTVPRDISVLSLLRMFFGERLIARVDQPPQKPRKNVYA